MLFLLGLALHQGLFAFVERLDEETKIKNSLLISFGLALMLRTCVQRSGRPTSARSTPPTRAAA